MLSAGFSLFPSIFKLPGLLRESPRQNSRVPIPGDSLDPWRRQLCRELLSPSSCSGSLFSMRELGGSWQDCSCLVTTAVAATAFSARGHMQQVQSQQYEGRRESARRQCETFSSFDFELTSWLLSICAAPLQLLPRSLQKSNTTKPPTPRGQTLCPLLPAFILFLYKIFKNIFCS